MKRCPECRRDYYDDTLRFCLDDGKPLLEGPATPSVGEPVTAILSDRSAFGGNRPANEAPTRPQLNLTDESAILETGEEAEPQRAIEKQGVSLLRISKPLFVILAVVASIGAGFFGYKYFVATKQIDSIAVIPFANESGDLNLEYLSDGMAETLISSLTKLPNLNVKARSTVFRYKGREADLKAIGKELNVEAILYGRIVQRGEQITLNLELVDVATENAIWSNRYNRKQSELVALQTEIARDVSSKLKTTLSIAETNDVERVYTASSEAYRSYLQGRFHWNKREIKEFEKAIVYFRQAIDKDPKYALAYSGLADTLALFPNYGNFRAKDYLPQAKEAALKAIELDSDLAEAHASLGQIIFYFEYDFAGSEREYKRAIELNPKYATTHQWYAERLSAEGRHDEAIREISKALELEPLSMIINQNMIQDLLTAERYDEALAHIKKFSEMFPDYGGRHLQPVNIYIARGKYAQAVDAYITHYTQAGKKPEQVQKLKEAFEKNGWEGFQPAYQEFILEDLKETQASEKNGYVKNSDIAFAYSLTKDKEKTLEYLNMAYDERSFTLVWLKIDRSIDFLRDDPRFKELVRKVGIPE